MDSIIEKFIKEQSKDFPSTALKTPIYSVGTEEGGWKAPNFEAKNENPGYLFYTYPAKVVQRTTTTAFSAKPSGKVEKNFFSFDKQINEELCKKSLDEKLESSQPLESLYLQNPPKIITDPRIEISDFYDEKVVYHTIDFKDLTGSGVEIIEPVVIDFFLYDIDLKRRVSETWRIIPKKLQSLPFVEILMSKMILNAPTSVSFPFPALKDQTSPVHSRIMLIVALDRELLKDGSASVQKYLQKPTSSNKKAAEEDVKKCNQFETTMTFAWSAKTISEILEGGEETEVVFDNFVPATTVSDDFLAEQFNEGIPKFKDKIVPYSLSIVVHQKDKGSVKLRHFYNSQHALPYRTFENTLFINLNNARFKFPRGMRGRNIVIHVQMINNGKPMKVFFGEDKYVTRTQYHEEKPSFFDEIKIPLPLDLPYETIVQFSIFHASVKPNASSSLERCGTAKFKLFENNCFVKNGCHDAHIDYGVEVVDTSESNKVFFETNLFSSIFSSDPQVSAILNGQMKASVPSIQELMPHLFAVLDALIEGIQDDKISAFSTLLEVLSLFTKERNDASNYPLTYYVKYCAFRHNHKNFYINCAKRWLEHIKAHDELARPDTQSSWFLFDLIVKSIFLSTDEHKLDDIIAITEALSKMMPHYRNTQTIIGASLNHYLALFFKDIIEISSRDAGFKMAITHLNNLHLTQHFFDRECFREFLSLFLTPKIFVFSLRPLTANTNSPRKQKDKDEGPTFFELYIIPPIKEALSVEQHTSKVFKILFNVLSQFTKNQNKFIFKTMKKLLECLAKSIDILECYENKSNYIYIFAFAHYVFTYIANDNNYESITKKQTELLAFQLRNVHHLTEEEAKKVVDELEKSDNSIEDLTRRLRTGYSEINSGTLKTGTRKFVSVKKSFGAAAGTKEAANQHSEELKTINQIFDTLAFCTQSVAIKIIVKFEAVVILNNIVGTFFDIEISPYLNDVFIEKATSFITKQIKTFYTDPKSNIKHIISKIIEHPSEQRIALLKAITAAERKALIKDVRTKILVTRALYKYPPTEETLALLESTEYIQLARKLFDINKDLTPQFKAENPDIYSFLLKEKSDLLIDSPDSRVDVLLQLYEHQNVSGFKSEAVMAQLCAAVLVSEYMSFFKRIPYDFFGSDHPAEKFTVACPAAKAMIVPPDQVKNNVVMRGYCTSRYFTEYGMIYLIQASMETCKTGNLFELSTRIHSLLNPVLEHRHLWRVLQKHYITGLLSWKISAQMYTASDRMLGLYYKVEFPDLGVFIYRETELLNLWQVCSKLEKSSKYYSNGKDVVVVSEGQELNKEKFNDPTKYYVHVKFLTQYFTPNERQKRITVFEQNHNINQFYFDVPFSKSAQSGLEHCSLKRTIFTLPYPLPYLVNRVYVPPENIEKIIFSPIEYAIQNLQSQVSKINESCVRVRAELAAAQKNLLAGKPQPEIQSFKELQPLIQGSLLVQVNEGPEKMAEVFLTGDENPHQAELRDTFREFIEANTLAVKIHGEMVMRFPIYSVLQEELELGLSKLTSKLQQYLK